MKKIFSFILITFVSVSAMMAHPGRLYLVGDATQGGWSWDNLSLMVTESDGVYEWVGDLNAGELKFLETPNWMPSYGPSNNGAPLASGELVKREQELESNDNKFQVSAGRYVLHVDLTGEILQLTVADGTGLPDKGFTTIYPEVIYAIGSATLTGWSLDDATAMNETSCNSGVYVSQVTLQTGELKFLHQRDWGKAYGASVAGTPVNGEGDFDMGLITDDSNDSKFAVALDAPTAYYVTVNAVINKMNISLNDPMNIESTVMTNEIEGVYDLQGRFVSLTPAGLPSGLYILKGSQKTQKIVIK